VFRATVDATERTNVAEAVADLRAKCERGRLAPLAMQSLLAQASEVLAQLVQRGSEIVSVGSQMQVTRNVTGDGYAVTLVFRAGVHPTFMQRILDALRSG
jgi:hypothetical protein